MQRYMYVHVLLGKGVCIEKLPLLSSPSYPYLAMPVAKQQEPCSTCLMLELKTKCNCGVSCAIGFPFDSVHVHVHSFSHGGGGMGSIL